jgi:hypothetical protein
MNFGAEKFKKVPHDCEIHFYVHILVLKSSLKILRYLYGQYIWIHMDMIKMKPRFLIHIFVDDKRDIGRLWLSAG